MTRILPAGWTDLIVQYGEPVTRIQGKLASPLPTSVIWGPRPRPVSVTVTGRTGFIIVVFRPFGALALIGHGCQDVDDAIPLATLIGAPRAEYLENAMQAATEPLGRVRCVERFLLERYPQETVLDPRVARAVRQMESSNEPPSISCLADTIGMSRRHLGRLFQETAGMAPKAFHRIVRFQRAMHARRQGKPWIHVAPACGYFDQAHLCRDFSELAGLTPGEFDRRIGSLESQLMEA